MKRLPGVAAVLLCSCVTQISLQAAPAQSSSAQKSVATGPAVSDTTAPNASDEKTINANYRLYEEALKNADAQDIIALEAPDFEVHETNGKTEDRNESDSELRQVFRSVTAVHTAKAEVVQLDFDKDKNGADTATAIVKQTFAATVMDKNHHPQQLKQNSVSRDVWVLVNNQWKIQSSTALSSTLNVTGNQAPVKRTPPKRTVRRVRRR